MLRIAARYIATYSRLFIIAVFIAVSFSAKCQYDPLYSQFYQNPLVINPAFTGFRNSLALDMAARRQWMGFNGAPKSAFLSVHSPVNKSKVSFGGFLQQYDAGPLSMKQLSFDYSYMARLGDKMLLSLGLGAGAISRNVGLTDLVLMHNGDPYFEGSDYNSIVPTVGVGAVLFTPVFYVGVSRPSIELATIHNRGAKLDLKAMGHYCLTAGIERRFSKKIQGKVSGILRLSDNGVALMDNSVQVTYGGILGIGAGIRYSHLASAMMSLQVNRNWGVTYSYDFALPQTSYITRASHEVSLSYDIYKFYKRNRFRTFKRKKVVNGNEMRSLRFF